MNEVKHMGQITINAVVYEQMPDGTFNPRAVWHDAFAMDFLNNNSTDCITELKSIIEELKNARNRLKRPA